MILLIDENNKLKQINREPTSGEQQAIDDGTMKAVVYNNYTERFDEYDDGYGDVYEIPLID